MLSSTLSGKNLIDPAPWSSSILPTQPCRQISTLVHVSGLYRRLPVEANMMAVVEEFPFDTCRAITSVINAGILIRMPNVRFLFSHNGGAFPYLADRIGVQHLDNVITKTNSGKNMREILSSSNIFFDTSISSPMQYPLIKDLCIPVEHLLYATDYPYTMRFDNDTYLAGFDAPKKSGVFSDEEMNKILYRNSLAVFPRLKALYDQFWP